MSEWFKEHAWKVCIPPKGIQGSNPCLSAKKRRGCLKRAASFTFKGKKKKRTEVLFLMQGVILLLCN